jgi:hypothetical protein
VPRLQLGSTRSRGGPALTPAPADLPAKGPPATTLIVLSIIPGRIWP